MNLTSLLVEVKTKNTVGECGGAVSAILVNFQKSIFSILTQPLFLFLSIVPAEAVEVRRLLLDSVGCPAPCCMLSCLKVSGLFVCLFEICA